jgi:hypothetical protein
MTVQQLRDRLDRYQGSDRIEVVFTMLDLPAFPVEVRADPLKGPGHVRIIVSPKRPCGDAGELAKLAAEPKPIALP